MEFGELTFKVVRVETAGQELLALAGNLLVARAASRFDSVLFTPMMPAIAGRAVMPLRKKRELEDYVCRRARELAEAGRFEGWVGIEFEPRLFEGLPRARFWLDDGPIREELDILHRQIRTRRPLKTARATALR